MQLLSPTPESASHVLRAVATVARAADGGLNPTHRAVMDTAQRMLLKTELDVDELDEISPDSLASRLTEQPEISRQVIRAMVLMSMAVGPPNPAQVELVLRFAAALGVDEPATRTIQHLTEHDMLLFRFDIFRRGNAGDYVREQYRSHGGFVGVAKAILGAAGILPDPKLAAQFRALKQLPTDTLGHTLYRFYTAKGFSFPGSGEKLSLPLGALFHDLGHILGGYDTSVEGEMLVASFQAGYRRTEDAFFTILFVVVVHSAGINLTPFELTVRLGRLGEMSEDMFIANQRGSSMNTDLGDAWDFLPWLERPLEEAREELGVPPLSKPPKLGALDLGLNDST